MEDRLESRFALASLKSRMFGHQQSVRVGSYVLEELVGRGGMGDVYRAHDPRLGRDVALKLLGRRTADDPQQRARLLKEARTLARLKHPNVITIHDVGSERDELYLAMEYVEGGDLDAWLSAEARPLRRIVDVLLDAGRGLMAAHRVGIVHRDFKPSNVLIDDEGHVRVVDFGVASLRGVVTPAATSDGSGTWATRSVTTVGTAGTPIYMAPEQHEGGAVDARADQFAWCATLYQALAGTEPFVARSPQELLAAKRAGQLATPRRRVPPRIMRIVRRGLRADPAERFASLQEPMEAIARAVVPWWRTTPARLGAALAVALAWGLWPAAERSSGCPTESQLVQAHWSDEHRASIAATLGARSPRYGPRAWSWIEPRLTAHVTHWADLERRSCESLLQGTQVPRTDARSVCLRRWASTFDSAVGSLAAGEIDRAREAIGVVEQIPEPRACGQRSVTGSSPLLSGADTAQERDRIMAYLEQLDRVQVLRRESYLGQVVEQLEPHVQLAADHGWVAAQAEGHTDLGMTLLVMERLDEAEQNLRAGVTCAVRSGHLYVEAHARIKLVEALGEHQAKFELAQLERTYAEAAVERLGDPLMRAEYEMVVGGLAWRQGDSTRASEHVSRAIELFEEHAGDDTLRHTIASGYLGSVLRQIEPERAEVVLRDTLATYEQELDPLHPLRLNAMTDLAESVSSQGRSEEALTIMQTVVELQRLQEPGRQRPYSQVVTHFRLASLLGATGEDKKAVAHLQAAYALAQQHFGDDHSTTVAVQLMLGMFATTLAAKEDDAKPWIQLAERHLVPASAGYDQTLGPSHPDSLLARLYLGKLRALRGESTEARALLEACIAYRTDQPNPSPAVPDVAVQARQALAELIEDTEPDRARALLLEAWSRLDMLQDPEIRASRRAELTASLCARGLLASGLECTEG